MNSSHNSERARLARELHDGLAQELASLGYRLDQVIGDTNLDNKNRYSLRELRMTLTGLVNQVRDEIFELRTNNSKPIAQQLTDQIPNLLTGSNIDYEINGDIEIDPSIRFEVIRAIREIVINSRRHSGCNQIKINLAKSEIKIIDNGSGGVSKKTNSYGVLGVKERLNQVNAEIQIDSGPTGTQTIIKF
jgi:two-component system, NarL family, sensor histidine kinase LiaS